MVVAVNMSYRIILIFCTIFRHDQLYILFKCQVNSNKNGAMSFLGKAIYLKYVQAKQLKISNRFDLNDINPYSYDLYKRQYPKK